MDPIQKKKLHFKGVSNAGDWRNSIKEVETVGDEVRLSDEYMYTMNVYPNHIESLVSL
ncbi:hypothetical protein AtEden1_Chr1g0058451 [Arabidopsis thaliana]